MSQFASYREMHPVAQQLVAKLFDALTEEAEDLIAMDRSKMSLVERGRWSAQVLRLMKALQKDYPEASESTKEGRQAIKRLKTPEELEEEAAEFDAILGLPPRKPLNGIPKPEPIDEPIRASQERERLEPRQRIPRAHNVQSLGLQSLTLLARTNLTLHKQERLRQPSRLRPLHFSFTTVVWQSLV